MIRTEVIGDATLILGDCLEILPTLGRVDAVITDPPYGVELTGKVTKHTDNRCAVPAYLDTEDDWFRVVPQAINSALLCADRAVVFSGIRRLHDYPKPRDIGGIICPNGAGRSPWGFGCYNPVLFYGKPPRIGSYPTAVSMSHPGMHVTKEDGLAHPCPKPLAFMRWAFDVGSLEGETILDPFMGSGTTGVAALQLGRKFIGIEIDETYFSIACKRIEEAWKQPRLFEEPKRKPQPAPSFFDGAAQ